MKMNPKVIAGIVVVLAILVFGSNFYQTVPPGYVAVASLFGEVQDESFTEGLHVPVNPFYNWYFFDARQKTHKESAAVPTQDQLQTQVDLSVQYRIDRAMVAELLKNVGSAADAINVHLVPKLRSLLREQGKKIPRAEDFFLEATQAQLQDALFEGLSTYLGPYGITISAVLIRDINLPPFITKAIEQKKEREQAVEKQKAELERFRTEQMQKVASAEAERLASEEEAKRIRIQADAKAYEILQINKAISSSPGYVQLQSLEALKAMSKDPAEKIYFMNADAVQPLPLMHMGDRLR